jgi:hypothetical protein
MRIYEPGEGGEGAGIDYFHSWPYLVTLPPARPNNEIAVDNDRGITNRVG